MIHPDTTRETWLEFPTNASGLEELTDWLRGAHHGAEAVVVHVGGGRELPRQSLDAWRRWDKALRSLERHPAPVVAALDGQVHGAGLQLLLSLDLVFASPGSTVSLAGLQAGQLPGMLVHRIAKHVGLGRAKELLFSGRVLTAAEAQTAGLLTEVTDSPREQAAQAVHRGPDPLAWTLARRLLLESYATTFEEGEGCVLAAQERALREIVPAHR